MKNNNKLKLFLIFIFVFFCLIMPTNAETKYVVLLNNVNIRKGPSTKYSTLKTGSVGSTYNLMSTEIIADEEQNGNCDAGWYQIEYNNEKAYVCSSYVRVDENETDDSTANSVCEKEMEKAGFPSSYWKGLCELKDKHPNWTFKAISTNLEWSIAVEKESSCGKSKIATSNSSFIDPTCHVDEGPFKGASQKAVAFYMDPRNFLTENYIFQFEYLKYEAALSSSYTTAINKMLSKASFYKYHIGKNVDFSGLTNTAGKELDINPISLASRMYQELGTGTSLYSLYSGVYTGNDKKYYGYYNFYNIGVTSSCSNTIVSCGLGYAKNRGWNTPFNAIKGGASLLVNNYLNKGQFTSYLQKFNVAPTAPNNLYLNQYMTNLAAPSSESSTTYNTYKNMGLLDSAFAFYIPVYKNMNKTIDNSGNGAVDDENNSSSSPSKTSIPTIITSAGYKVSNSYIKGIKPNTEIKTIKNNLESIAGNGHITITNADDKSVSSGLIGTGYKVTIKNNSEEKTYTVVIHGDTSGDGIINAKDLLQVQRNILGTYNFNNEYKLAGDTSGDGIINAKDLLEIQRQILGNYTIKQ